MRSMWLVWAVFGIVAEFVALATGRVTLSQTWFWVRDALPLPVSLLASAALGALFAWLLSVHWIFSGLDRPGFDILEKVLVVLGLVAGTAGGVVSRRRRNDDR